MDRFSKEKRSKIMSAIRSRDTLPEIAVRKWLFAHGAERERTFAKLARWLAQFRKETT